MQINQSDEQTEYKQMLRTYHKLSDRHVLVLEADLSYQDKYISNFEQQYNKEKAIIGWIKANDIKVLNSGIKAS